MPTPCMLCGQPMEPPPDLHGLAARLCSFCVPPGTAHLLSEPPGEPAPAEDPEPAPSSPEDLLEALGDALRDEEAPAEPPPPEEPPVPSQLGEELPLQAFRRSLDGTHPVLLQELLETLTLEQQATLFTGVTHALEVRLGLRRGVDPERVPPAWDRVVRWPPERRQALAEKLAGLPAAAPLVEWIEALDGPGERAFPRLRLGLGHEVLRRLGDRVRQLHTRAMFGKALLRAERQRLGELPAPTPAEEDRRRAVHEQITHLERDQLPVFEGWLQEVADLCDFFEATPDPSREGPARARARRTARRLAHSPAFTELLEAEDRRFLEEAVVPALED